MFLLNLLFFSLLLFPIAKGDSQNSVLYVRCDKNKYANGSAFQRNLERVMISLVANVSETGFKLSSYGDGDKVDGLAACRGDLSRSECGECIAFAKDHLIEGCNSISASILFYGCFLRYNKHTSVSERADDGLFCQFRPRNTSAGFNVTVAEALSKVVSNAILAPNAFSVSLTPRPTIYSLAQCRPDLRKNLCKQCLLDLKDLFFSSCSPSDGSYGFNSDCCLGFDVNSFFNLAALSPTPGRAIQSEAWLNRQVCGNREYENGGVFEKNLHIVLDSFISNASKTGFGNFSYGENGDKIYGMIQCRRDLNAAECSACASLAKQNILQTCNKVSAANFLSGCFLRYENYNFYSRLESNADGAICSQVSSDNSTEFGSGIERSVSDLINDTISSNGFSTGEVNLTLGATVISHEIWHGDKSDVIIIPGGIPVTIYFLAQCWNDLDMQQCKQCLNNAYEVIVSNCSMGDLGPRALSYNCYLRYDTQKFSHALPSHRPSAQVSAGRATNHTTLRVILASCISATAIFLVLLALILRKGRILSCLNKKPIEGKKDSATAVYEAMPNSKLNYKFQILQSCTGNFSPANKLGQGGYGSVYKGDLPDGREIAVKRLFSNREESVNEFLNEVNIISQVRHKNLVKLLGCSVKGHERLLVYEYLPKRSLDQHLFDPIRNNVLSWEKRFEIILGTAAGLAYLHQESEIRIIHRDIKASNILLDQNFKPKIADFGLARHFAEDQSHISTALAGTIGYMAPEYIVNGQLTEKADVFSFGVVVLEIISGKRNNQSRSGRDVQSLPQVVWKYFISNTLSRIIDPNIVETCKEDRGVTRAIHVGLLCTQASAPLRPSMPHVVHMLLNSDPNFPLPSQPPFMNLDVASDQGSFLCFGSLPSSSGNFSLNPVSVSLEPR